MKKVPLGGPAGKGKFALIDDEDVQLVAKHTWYLSSTGYAVTTIHISGNKKIGVVQKGISMHRLIMGFPEEQVDHVNRDRLDNQRSNLRLASHAQNCWNAEKQPSNTGYRGVRKESENVFSTGSVRWPMTRSWWSARKRTRIAACKTCSASCPPRPLS